ncbi:MAG: YcfL family protein [Puniceicoccales bacterium]|jgi:uncharacterized protein YcfL|nr:YcfL family protein [Puniceicoccales bacterium]
MSFNKHVIFSACALVGIAAITMSCAPTVNTVESANPRASITPEQMKHFKTDSALNAIVKPIFLSTGVADDGTSLKVQLQVQNTTRRTAHVSYRVNWLDKQGLSLAGHTPVMIPLFLEGGAVKRITVTAPSPRAVDFQFEFIERRGD